MIVICPMFNMLVCSTEPMERQHLHVQGEAGAEGRSQKRRDGREDASHVTDSLSRRQDDRQKVLVPSDGDKS